VLQAAYEILAVEDATTIVGTNADEVLERFDEEGRYR
jgi:hypothetical protein